MGPEESSERSGRGDTHTARLQWLLFEALGWMTSSVRGGDDGGLSLGKLRNSEVRGQREEAQPKVEGKRAECVDSPEVIFRQRCVLNSLISGSLYLSMEVLPTEELSTEVLLLKCQALHSPHFSPFSFFPHSFPLCPLPSQPIGWQSWREAAKLPP